MPIRLYGYAKCGSCKKAQAWLREHELEFEFVSIVDRPPSAEQLRDYWKRSELPLKKFFNTSGKSYRAGSFSERLKTLSDEEALAELAKDGMLIKRPLIVSDDQVVVGFKPDALAGFVA